MALKLSILSRAKNGQGFIKGSNSIAEINFAYNKDAWSNIQSTCSKVQGSLHINQFNWWYSVVRVLQVDTPIGVALLDALSIEGRNVTDDEFLVLPWGDLRARLI